jgi:hypothetical protein
MSGFAPLKTDVDCGWNDEVGGSICAYAVKLASDQEKAAEALSRVMAEGEKCLGQNPTYKSHAESIRACKID